MKKTCFTDICTLIMGQSPDSSSYNTNYEGLPFYQGNSDFGELHPVPRVWCSEPKKIAQENDILISVRAPIGDLNIANEKCCIGRGLAAIRIINSDNVDLTYLYHFFESKRTYLQEKGTGSTFKAINKDSLINFVIPLPSIKEQESISQELSALHLLIKGKKTQLFALDELVKSRFIEMFGDIVRNDKSWATEIITKVCPIKQYDGRITECDGKIWLLNLDLVESNTGVILDKYYVAKTEIGNSTITFSEDNVLYSKLRPYLNKVVVPDGNGYATSELIPFFPLSQVNKYYLAYALRSESFVTLINSKAGGAKMPRAPMDFIRSFPLPIPPIELQNEFAEFVKLIDKSKFVCHSKNFLCDIFTFSSSTIAYPSVVSIFVCPKRC